MLDFAGDMAVIRQPLDRRGARARDGPGRPLAYLIGALGHTSRARTPPWALPTPAIP
jgi:hypothetical protein